MSEMYMPDSPNGGYRPLPKREFIVELAEDGDRSLSIVRPDDVREAIIRCKDCKHYIDHAWVILTDVEHICTFWNGGNGVKVEPEGFCKWGERRGA